MAPVIAQLSHRASFCQHKLCVTGQHNELLDQALAMFKLKPDINLKLMLPNQTLPELMAKLLVSFTAVLERLKPSAVLVHGDTLSSFGCAWAAYQKKIPVAHVEAGLRTHDFYQPFPEESNRVLTDRLSTWCFAPTTQAKKNLRAEGIAASRILVTGNTVVDALHTILKLNVDVNVIVDVNENVNEKHSPAPWQSDAKQGKTIITLTMHRRESFDGGLQAVCQAVLKILAKYPQAVLYFPRHPNPKVLAATRGLEKHPQVKILPPLDYVNFINLLRHSSVILSDSGGVQEEAPSLGVPVVVLRDKTERPELLKTGWARLAGTEPGRIVRDAGFFLEMQNAKCKMQNKNSKTALARQLGSGCGKYRRDRSAARQLKNPFGTGQAAQKIVERLRHDLS